MRVYLAVIFALLLSACANPAPSRAWQAFSEKWECENTGRTQRIDLLGPGAVHRAATFYVYECDFGHILSDQAYYIQAPGISQSGK